jgi:hypothetical protein
VRKRRVSVGSEVEGPTLAENKLRITCIFISKAAPTQVVSLGLNIKVSAVGYRSMISMPPFTTRYTSLHLARWQCLIFHQFQIQHPLPSKSNGLITP